MVPTLGYWSFRGLTEPIRLLLHYLGVEYKETFYHLGLRFSPEEWLREKFNLGLDFPNLPYYIDGDFKLTQSAAIIEYIADQHDMLPACKKSRAVLHINLLVPFLFSFSSHLVDAHRQYENYLGEKQWLTGEKINYPDFNLWDILDQLRNFEPTCLKNFPKLTAYLTRFENLPQLKKYLASREFKDRK
ncbi:hypothetical protein Aperf_G00000056779 [Anoplocephala perfoliata]